MLSVRLIFKSGHVEVVSVPDDSKIEWKWGQESGKLTKLMVPEVIGCQGAWFDIEEIAAFFVMEDSNA